MGFEQQVDQWREFYLAVAGAAAVLLGLVFVALSLHPIWGVRLGDDPFVRSVNGRAAAWFRGTQVHHEGRSSAGGVLTPRARSATIRLIPRPTTS